MKSLKFIVVLFLVLLFSLPVTGDKRPNKKSMKELTDPDSPSYVPYPYPKNRKEIIADLRYYVEYHCGDVKGMKKSYVKGFYPVTQTIFHNLMGPNPDYEVGKIIKVKNRMEFLSDDYYWLIPIMDREGNIAMLSSMLASGLMAVSGANTKEDIETASPQQRYHMKRQQKPLTDEKVKSILSESLGYSIEDHEIIKMERVAYPGTIGAFLHPVWEIKMTGNRLYYYSDSRDTVYSVEKRLQWKKNSNGFRKARREMASHRDYLPDMLNDEFVILKKIPRKK